MGYARSSDDGKQKYTGLQSFGWGNGRLGYEKETKGLIILRGWRM